MSKVRSSLGTVFALAAAAVLVASIPSQAALGKHALTGSAWPEMLGDAIHSSYSTDSAITSGNASSFGVKWMANLYSADWGSPVVAYNTALGKTVVYAGDNRADMFAIDASTGQEIWSTNLGVNDKTVDTPMVAPDGSVWVGTSYNARMFKLNGATGAVECSIKALMPVNGSPMLATPPGGQETVYWDYLDSNVIYGPLVATVESSCGQIFKFDGYHHVDGTWTTPVLGQSASGEPLILIGTTAPDSTEYAVDAVTGKEVWNYVLKKPKLGEDDIGDGATVSNPGINGFADGAAYFNAKAGIEYALDLSTGGLIWQFTIAPDSNAQSSRSSAALDGTSLVFGYGHNSGFGGSGGVYSLNAITGNVLWQYPDPVEVISSPAIVGPSGSEVVAFGDLTGAFRLLSLANGASLYKGQTGSYITASPAEANGTIFITSTDGFLYAYEPNGGNGSLPSTSIASPANHSIIKNPDGSLTISGTSSDAGGVNAVEIAVEQGGESGPWYDAATGKYNSAPVRNAATLSSPGGKSTNWTFTFPAPASGGTFTAFANSVNVNHIVDKGATSNFVISPDNGEPNVTLSTGFVPPGSSVIASSNGFNAGEQVTFSLADVVVATVKASPSGHVDATIHVKTTEAFGPTSLVLDGKTSGKTTSATLDVTNSWTQFGYDPGHSSDEPNDPVIEAVNTVGNNTVLSQSWYFVRNAPVNSTPTVVDGLAYFGDDKGLLSAVVTSTGAPKWQYKSPSGSPIRTAPAVDSGGRVIFTSSDGNLYLLRRTGLLVSTTPLGGNLTSPSVDVNQIFVASDNGHLYDVSDLDGSVTWSEPLSGAGHSAPAFDAGKNIVVAGDDSGAITAFNATTGSQLWKVTTGGAVVAPPLITHNTVYVGSGDGNFYAISETAGTVTWKMAMTGPIIADAGVYSAGVLTVGDSKGIVDFITMAGKLVVQIDTGSKSPVVGLSNVFDNVFVNLQNGLAGMIRTTARVPFSWSYQTGSTLSTSPAIIDGTVYIGAADGGLYAFTPNGKSPYIKTQGGAAISITDDSKSWECTTP